MADRDAFGRDTDDNSLADMGWSTSGGSSPASSPSPLSPAPTATTPPTAATPPRRPRIEAPRPPVTLSGPRRSSGMRTGAAIFVTLLTIGIVGGAVALVGMASDSSTSVTSTTVPAVTETAQPTVPAAPSTASTPSSPAAPAAPKTPPSLFDARTFSRVLALAHRRAGGRLVHLAVYRGYLSAIAVNHGSNRVLVIGAAGDIRINSTSTGAALPSSFAWSRVHPRATARLARSVRHLSRRSMNYAVLSDILGLKWTAYDSGAQPHYYFATPAGRVLRRLG